MPIDSIVTVETRKFSNGKAALLGAGITQTVQLIATLVLIQ
jgi:hypothetical protein